MYNRQWMNVVLHEGVETTVLALELQDRQFIFYGKKGLYQLAYQFFYI